MANRWEIATWRCEQIAPLADEGVPESEKQKHLREKTTQKVVWPLSDGEIRRGKEPKIKVISESTLYRWLDDYRRAGLHGLVTKPRSDRGKPREDRSESISYAIALLLEEVDRSLDQLLVYLKAEYPDLDYSRSTLDRELKAHPAYGEIERRRNAGGKKRKTRDRYEVERPHEVWQLDGKGPFQVRLQGGKTVKVHVLSIIDAASRFILAAVICTSESTAAAVRVFRRAALLWGLATLMQFDRGSAFESMAFRTGIALLGTHRTRVEPKNPEAQGLIEAYHRALGRWFVKELLHQEVIDLEHLEQLLIAMLEVHYNEHWHRELKDSPRNVLAGQRSERRVAEEELERIFRVEVRERSHPKTGVVKLPNGRFKVPARYAGKQSTFRYDPDQMKAVLVIRGREIECEPDQKKKFPPDYLVEKRGTGQLQKLLDIYQGKKRPNAQPGFGLPEVFRAIGELLGHLVPSTEQEAREVTTFYAKHGPLPAEPFEKAIEETRKALGTGRPVSAYLDHLERIIRAHQERDSIDTDNDTQPPEENQSDE